MRIMAQSSSDLDPRLQGYERIAQQAHDAAIVELREQWPMNGPTYSLRYGEFVQAYFREHNYRPDEPR